MIELQSTLEPKKELLPNHLYMVDFGKLQSVNELVLILASMGIGFPSEHPNIEKLKPFLNLEVPIPMEQPKPEFVPLKFKEDGK